MEAVKLTVRKAIGILGIENGTLNLELMFNEDDKLYIVKIGPRNGGNIIPGLTRLSTGVNTIAATVESSSSHTDFNLKRNRKDGYYSAYVIHSKESGILKNIVFSEKIQKNILSKVMYKSPLDDIERFRGANRALGIIFLKYDSTEEEKYKMDNMNEFIRIEVG